MKKREVRETRAVTGGTRSVQKRRPETSNDKGDRPCKKMYQGREWKSWNSMQSEGHLEGPS